ncbi:MAG: glycosyltransferase family 9 protein [Candidatus Liptonbacteria bacterium]
MRTIKRVVVSRLKFFYKTFIVRNIRALLLFLFGASANKKDWNKRLLIVYLQSIGDVIVFTSVLQHYRAAFPGKKIYLLAKDGLGVEKFVQPFVDEVINVNYRGFVANPFYGFRLVSHLRRIGFHTVINQDHSPVEIIGKMITVSLQAEYTIGYEGAGILFREPYDANMAYGVNFSVQKLYPKFSRIVPSLDKQAALKSISFKSVIEHYIYYFKQITGKTMHDFATCLSIGPADERVIQNLLSERGLSVNHYAVINLGSNATWRNWPVERFAKVSIIFSEKHIPVVLIGAEHQKYLAQEFKRAYKEKVEDFVGILTLQQSFALIKNCFIVLTNDTSTVHAAVALRKPSLCIVGRGYANSMAFYGYRDINVWVFKETSCVADNWQCTAKIKPGEIAPCIDAVRIEDVNKQLVTLLDYCAKTKEYPNQPFEPSFLS